MLICLKFLVAQQLYCYFFVSIAERSVSFSSKERNHQAIFLSLCPLNLLLSSSFWSRMGVVTQKHCRRILYQLSHREAQEYWSGQPSPSPGSSQHRNRTGVSCIAGGFFTNWAIREAHTETQLTKIICQRFWSSGRKIPSTRGGYITFPIAPS